MSNATLHLKLMVAEHFARHLSDVLHDAQALARKTVCPPPSLAAVHKACTDALALWLHVGNVATLFELDAEPGPE